MNRLPKENIYTTRCAQCGSLILLGGDELRERWEPEPVVNRGYVFKCPGCGGRPSYTTEELLMKRDNCPSFIDFDDYVYAQEREIGHGIVLEEGDNVRYE